MTRFARAKGSKASNERVADEATPWRVMKEQLEENITMKKRGDPKAKSAKELLREKDEPYYHDSMGNTNNEWAEFGPSGAVEMSVEKKNVTPEIRITKESKKRKIAKNTGIEETAIEEREKNVKIASKSKKRKTTSESEAAENDSGATATEIVVDETSDARKSAKKRKSVARTEIEVTEDTQKIDEAEAKTEKKKKKKRDKKANRSKMENTEICESTENKEEKAENSELVEENERKEMNAERANGGRISKRHKRNQKRINKNAMAKAAVDATSVKKPEVTNYGGFDASGNDWSSNVNFGKDARIDDGPDGRTAAKASTGNSENRSKGSNFREDSETKRKSAKIRDEKEHKRRKPETGSIKCIINGTEVEIVKYDGFPVKKEDAERLKELRRKMAMKAIPRSEIDVAMKLERRKAEKSLARMRKQVCFNCRKAGHNLSDCPELGDEESATGICFKCGSTEHTHFECKVAKKEEFRFASCFICREQGHIAKQCPDNPKGLYPQGGACKICGDVTHLRKDCPDLTRDKEESNVTLGTIAENMLESLDDNSIGTITTRENSKKSKNIVKF